MSSAESDAPARPSIRIGLLLAGSMSSRERHLSLAAGRRLQRDLSQWFPRYDWRVEAARGSGLDERRREESSELLRLAAEARERAHQDFVMLITANELVARYRAFALAALSRPLDAAVLSTARLVPDGSQEVDALSDDTIVDRLTTLMVHALAHLAGERSTHQRDRLLHRPDAPTDLDAMTRFDDRELAALDAAFESVADTRLEERTEPSGSRLRFTISAAAINSGEIAEAVRAARPWEFPQRLARLTTAAVSTLAILLMTAESWDLGLSQSWATVLALALIVLALTSGSVIHRQQLLLARHGHLSEQLVVTRVAAVLIVVAGLATTWIAVFTLALAGALALFDAPLIVGWAASRELGEADVDIFLRLRMATFCASIGLLIGSLGASFEDQHHFRHVIFVDEEL